MIVRIAASMLALMPMAATPLAAHGVPAQATQLYIVIYRPGPTWIAGKPMHQQKLGPHVRYVQGLLAEGRLVAGGPFTDGDGGMAIYRAANLDEAKAMLAADPAITSGVFAADMRPWNPLYDNGKPLKS